MNLIGNVNSAPVNQQSFGMIKIKTRGMTPQEIDLVTEAIVGKNQNKEALRIISKVIDPIKLGGAHRFKVQSQNTFRHMLKGLKLPSLEGWSGWCNWHGTTWTGDIRKLDDKQIIANLSEKISQAGVEQFISPIKLARIERKNAIKTLKKELKTARRSGIPARLD